MGSRNRTIMTRADSGVAMILVLLAILVLTTLAAAIVFSARAETFASYNFKIGTQAEYVARAGIQKALNFINNTTQYASLSPTSGPPCPTLTQMSSGWLPAASYDIEVTMITSGGLETAPSPLCTVTLISAGGIDVGSPGAQGGFTRYRVYAAPHGGTLVYQSTTDLGTDFIIKLHATGPAPPAIPSAPALSPGAAGSGLLLAGTYDVAMAFFNSAGVQSNIGPRSSIAVVLNGSIIVGSPPAQTGFVGYAVYGAPTGGTLHFFATNPFGASTAVTVVPSGPVPPANAAAPTVASGSGSMAAATYDVVVTQIDNNGMEWPVSSRSSIALSANSGISVNSPPPQPGFGRYRVYAGPTGGALYLQSSADLGVNYNITPLDTGAGPPAAASPGLNPYYNLAVYDVNPAQFFFTSNTPVKCSSNCNHSGAVALGTSASSSAYPPAAATLDSNGNPVDVVTNWVNAMNNTSITDPTGGSGNYTVTATLLEYHTVNNAFFGVAAPGCTDPAAPLGICRQPYEVWQVTSTGTWNNNVGAGAANPTVVVTATIAPMFLPYFGNALYGLCHTILSGKVCTDAYNSSVGAYGGTAGSCATPSTTTGTNDTASGAGVGSNGGVTLNGASGTIGGNVTFADSTGNAACDTGFQGYSSGVAGSVLPGPAVPTPPPPDMTVWGYAGTPAPGPPFVNSTAPNVSPASNAVANVYTQVSTPPTTPPGVSCPAGYTGYLVQYSFSIASGGAPHAITYSGISCTGLSGSGTSSSPYRLGNIDASSGSSSNPATINFIAPGNSIGNPTYIASNSINTGSHGNINFSYQAPSTPTTDAGLPAGWPSSPLNQNSAFVVDVGNNVTVGGTATLNYNPSFPGVPAPDYLRLNVLGNGGSGSSGSCSGGSVAVDLGGQGALAAMITAPNGAVRMAGSGSGGVFFGAILGSNVLDCGNYAVHYDLSMRVQTGKLYPTRVVSVTRPQL